MPTYTASGRETNHAHLELAGHGHLARVLARRVVDVLRTPTRQPNVGDHETGELVARYEARVRVVEQSEAACNKSEEAAAVNSHAPREWRLVAHTR